MAGRTFLLSLVPFASLTIAVALPQMVKEVMIMTTVTLLPGETAPSVLPDSSDSSFSSWSSNNGPVRENKFAVKQHSGNQGQNFQQAQVLQQQPAISSTIPVQQPQATTQTTSSTTGDTTDDDTTTNSTSCSTTPPSTMSDLLTRHNYYRTMHQAGDICWDASLASHAQQDSSSIGCGAMVHAQGEGVGENLMNGQTTGTAAAVDGWYSEISQYDWSDPGFKNTTGHFTQVVWKGSTSLGCDVSCG